MEITNKKQKKAPDPKTDDRLSRIVESARLGWWDWNIETGELVWSRECLEMFGLPADSKMSYEAFLQAIYPDDRERVDRDVRAALDNRTPYSTQMRSVWPDGTMHWILSRGRGYYDAQGKAVRMSGAGMDITQFKETEENLRRAEEEAKAQADNFAAVFDAVPAAAFFSNDRDCKKMVSNRAAYDLLRVPYGGNTSMSGPEAERPKLRIFENGRELSPEELPVQKAARTGQEVRGKELEIRFDDGSSSFEFGHAVPLFNEKGKVRGAVGAFMDVTDRKIMEERMRTATERFRLALRDTPVTVFSQDRDLRYKWMYNPVPGYNTAEIIGKRDSDFLERNEDAERLDAIKSEVMRSGNIYRGEVELYHQGTPRTFHVTIEPQRNAQGDIIGLTCASFDLTDRKVVENQLNRLARQRQLALDTAQMGWWHYDLATDTCNWDDRFKNAYGLTMNSGAPQSVINLVHPDDVAFAIASFRAAMDTENPRPYRNEYRIIRGDGALRWIEAHGAGEFEGQGEARRAVGCSGTVRDITDRKAAEEQLRQSNWRTRQLIDSNIIPVVCANMKGIVEANDAFLQLIGYTRLELKRGEVSWVRMTPQEYLSKDYEALEQLKELGFWVPYEKEYVTKNGRKIPVLVGAAVVTRSPLEWQCFVVDLTQLKRAQADLEETKRNLEIRVEERTRELQQRTLEATLASEGLRELSGRLIRIQDEERRRIGRELHDSAGQIVTALDIELTGLMEQVRKVAPNLAKQAEGTHALVQQLHSEIRTTSYLLHPPLLDEAGLPSAIGWYVQGLNERSDIEIELQMDNSFGRLPRDMELVVFRLVQESMTNIRRHSGSKVATIRVARDENAVYVEVQDRGSGMSPQHVASILSGGSGVGIRGMRERLRQFQGELKIDSDSSGTRVLATIPIPRAPSADGMEEVKVAM